MPTVQSLKKKLQVIRSTQKLTKAMKNASTVKYSKLSTVYSEYEKYEQQCNRVYNLCPSGFASCFAKAEKDAPVCYVVMTSDKGMNGAFNPEILSFFENTVKNESDQPVVLVCGNQGIEYFESKKIAFESSFAFGDVPSYAHATQLFEAVVSLINEGRASCIRLIYPQYVNMMVQKPVCVDLFDFSSADKEEEDIIFMPDKEAFIKNTATKILISMIYKKILETALGAQASTLTAMRSAYDTACEYCEQLERDINRKRQSQVTADVIEISSEFSQGGMLNG